MDRSKRIFRFLVVLILVGAMIVNVSPIRAKAIVPETALGLGVVALLLLGVAGVAFHPDTAYSFVDVGNSFINYMSDWSERNDKSDIVDVWIRGVQVDLTGGGGNAPLHIPPEIQLAVAEWIVDLLTGDEKIVYSGGSGFQVVTDISVAHSWSKSVDFVSKARAANDMDFFAISCIYPEGYGSGICGYTVLSDSNLGARYIVGSCLDGLSPYTDLDFPMGEFVPGLFKRANSLFRVYLSYDDAYKAYIDKKVDVYYLTDQSYAMAISRTDDSSNNNMLCSNLYELGCISSSGNVTLVNSKSIEHANFYGYYRSYGIIPRDFQYTSVTVVGDDITTEEDVKLPNEIYIDPALNYGGFLGTDAIDQLFDDLVDGKITHKQLMEIIDPTHFPGSDQDPDDPEETEPEATQPVVPNPDISDSLQGIHDGVSKLPNQIGDSISDILNQGQSDAQKIGQDGINQIIDVIPDHSADLLGALRGLTDVLSYQGTKCVLPVPAIRIPALPGLFSEITVMEESELDLEQFFQMLPDGFLSLVRALFDIAVVGFCLKEFLDLLAGIANGFSK